MYNVSMAYIQGVQASLAQAGIVNYANEEAASEDAAMLGQGVQEQLPIDQGGLATEGAAPQETVVIAKALEEMAEQAGSEAGVAKAKAEIVQNAVSALSGAGAGEETAKFAAEAGALGDNLVVAGYKPGYVAAGESNAKATDHDQELSNAIDNTSHREDVFHSMPGYQADEGKGYIGSEAPHPGAEGNPGQVEDLDQELSNAVSNTKDRPNYHGAPGSQSDEDKGHIGTEKLSSVLARL